MYVPTTGLSCPDVYLLPQHHFNIHPIPISNTLDNMVVKPKGI